MGSIINLCCDQDKPRIQSNNPHSPSLIPPNPETAAVPIRKSYSQPILCEVKVSSPVLSPIKNSFQEPDDQFYDIESFIVEREKSKLQPQKMTSDNFEIQGLLGQGAFCNVFMVTVKNQPENEKPHPLAMKKIPKAKLSSQKTKESIRLQRHILATSCSRFITTLQYAFLDKQHLYIVMQFASGGDANRFIINSTMRQQFLKSGQQSVKFIVACVILALEYLHSQGIIFRDLKPENILLFQNGYAKLSDFGLAKLLPDKDQRTKTLAGTAVYCSPEMILQVGYNKSIDFWALGILIYELTTGETPFKLEDVSTKLRFKRIAIEEETNRKWRGHRMNPATTDIVGELLRFSPDDRLGMKGWQEIKRHRYFFGFDWQALNSGLMASPLAQIIKDNPIEVKQYRTVPLRCQQNSQDSVSEIEGEQQWNFNHVNTR